MKKSKNDHKRPLQEDETDSLTIGCRHSNPDICAKHSMPGICAFVSSDNRCYAPPASWKGLYQRLLNEKE